jgi:hypothetical protein
VDVDASVVGNGVVVVVVVEIVDDVGPGVVKI